MSFSHRARKYTGASRISTKVHASCASFCTREETNSNGREMNREKEVKEMGGTDKSAPTNAYPARGKD